MQRKPREYRDTNPNVEPSNDPEIAQNAIEFLHRLITSYTNVLLSQHSSTLEPLVFFTLKALTGSDPLPKIAAADFWVPQTFRYL